jgi:hypothetical protein
MWLFTRYGFYSAVCARQGDGRKGRPVDPDRIMVRARLRSHLEALRNRFPDLLADCEILETADTDYYYSAPFCFLLCSRLCERFLRAA